MTKKTTGKRDRNQALVAALTLLGASLGISTPSTAADTTGLFLKGHDTTTSKQHKGDVELHSYTVKGQAPASTQIKGETTSNQYKEHSPSASFLKLDSTSSQIKGETTSTQYKEHAPSAMFLKIESSPGTDTTSSQHKGQSTTATFLKRNAAPVSTQQKGDVQSNQIKLNGGVYSKQQKGNVNGDGN